MNEYRLADVEAKFADIIWKNEPISSPDLVKICERELNWKKSTTYTVLKKLIEKGIFQNEKSIVSAKLSREEFYGHQSQVYVEETFGSLPKFLTAFFQGRKISKEEAEELMDYIDNFKE
ncbi:MAG: BlaI/MecI/CopY family transcriptional regulator [Lachnoclostridium sp.]|nr:BlaI/MecI/CopY family transcriptional regulator [Lachnospira sp.]MCM1248097.1 BlaI/MecI/CopY family transcriptional regulator [Lachnoclostridium sp.]